MALALAEARKGVGRTAPNPPVGAVVVGGGVLLGSGWHRAAGQPHAEVEALRDAVARHGAACLRGAGVYVSLEPCSTEGRTPACTAGLIEAGVARVVYACDDPHPAHAGRAAGILREAGIEVASGVMEREAADLIRPFAKVLREGLPWVVWKIAMTMDGRITRPGSESRWISGEESRADVMRLRGQADAILTSGETVRRDLPALTIRGEGGEGRSQPWRVVFTDAPASLPREAPLFSDEWSARTLVRPRADLAGSLRRLVAEQGVLSVLVEAGGVFGSALFEAGLVDEVVVYFAPMLAGGGVPALGGTGLPASLRLGEVCFERFGDDIRLRALVERG
jgi:diaminohydroxyphosphoribosylaminopyrimidine deaminase/5-amino-6-(5-phosphoribosylamino)uracil reductase